MDKEETEINSPSEIIDDIVTQNSDKCKYYDLEELNNCMNDFKFCALHINIHSLVSKLDKLKNILCYIQENKTIVHFILLRETFLNDKKTDLCNIEGYYLVCNNR